MLFPQRAAPKAAMQFAEAIGEPLATEIAPVLVPTKPAERPLPQRAAPNAATQLGEGTLATSIPPEPAPDPASTLPPATATPVLLTVAPPPTTLPTAPGTPGLLTVAPAPTLPTAPRAVDAPRAGT
jgi:hypothetical protein